VSSAKIDKLVRMVNQIADAFGALPAGEASASAATHLRMYWTPKMIRELVAFVDSGQASLNPIAAGAVAALKNESVA
jgi:formate dehydrogenase subunit delta